ncbi:lymphotactin-like [Elgaria multicarinata webbii]|uniref:lymphotactin-like n=1 Tax=Elgaria multicarinata webbii TaxID=159646 RepID=UPI002FCD35CD
MKLYVAAILAISFLENFKVCIVRGAVGVQTIAQSTCDDFQSEEIKYKSVIGYERLENSPLEAVILMLRKGAKVCVRPDLPWVKKIIRLRDAKTRKRKRKTSRSAATIF